MKQKKKKIVVLVLALLCILLAATGYGVGNYFVGYALTNDSDSGNREVSEDASIEQLPQNQKLINENKAIEQEQIAGYEQAFPFQTASITTKDDLKLQALWQKNNEDHRWVILVHGYKSNNEAMKGYAYRYALNSYNILMPNNRAHGDSEGTYIGMGWLDKEDIKLWIDWILAQDEQAEIILHGVSMGGATIMNVAGDDPAHVVGYIEDCGYTSVWDIFASELDARFSLPAFPILNLAELVANFKAGYDIKEASSLKQIKNATKPVLFIHGDQDDFVPTAMVYELYDAASCTKELYIAKGAGHAEARLIDPDTYWGKVFSFLDEKVW